MPNPIEILLDPVSLVILSLFSGLFLWESIFPGRKLPKVNGWVARGIFAFAFYFYLSSYLPLLYDAYLAPFQLIDLSHLGPVQGGLIGVLLYEFGIYVWHRFMHTSNFLWRTFHQMHHSAERLDIPGAFYFSPMDMIGFTVLGSLCFTLIIGLSPQAVTVVLLSINFLGIFQHANIRTPQWLGYIVQRPESHSLHHGRGVHRYNYSDLPLFDILFGTFRNPREFQEETGFYNGASARVWDMLRFKDVSRPEKKETKQKAAV